MATGRLVATVVALGSGCSPPALDRSVQELEYLELYVDDSAPSIGANGFSWDHPFNNLRVALQYAAAHSGPEGEHWRIHVARGMYEPDQSPWSFYIPSGTIVLGGFAGYGAADPDARDVDAFTTTLRATTGAFWAVSSGTLYRSFELDGFTFGGPGGGVFLADGVTTISRARFVNGATAIMASDFAITTIRDSSFERSIVVHTADAAIERCDLDGGAGISFENSHSTIDHLELRGGGGIVIAGSTVAIASSTFSDAEEAAIVAEASELDLSASELQYNYRAVVLTDCADSSITDSAFVQNGDASDGAALWMSRSDPEIVRSSFVKNHTAGRGAIYLHRSSPRIRDSELLHNIAALEGGALYSDEQSHADIANTVFSGNRANYGGAIFDRMSTTTISNATLYDNTAVIAGHVIMSAGSLTRTHVRNSIVWGNATYNPIDTLDAAIPRVDHSDIESPWMGQGSGNLSIDPQLRCVPPAYPVACDVLDLRPSSGSPVIDRGANALVPVDVVADLAGRPRIADGDGDDTPIVDMGAYEVAASCQGDLDGDGQVALADLSALLAHFGATGASAADGDLDGDGDVDLADLSALLAAFGTTC